MARLSNHIEDYLRALLLEREGQIEIKRNVLAEHFNCAPSQINYVLTTRFTPVQGFFVESRRGGGGFIRIVQVEIKSDAEFYDRLTEAVGKSITQSKANQILDTLEEMNYVTENERHLLGLTLSDRALAAAGDKRNGVRADLLQNILLGIFS
ncbi:CtsR family transcriptional regulator [Aedoeadaptatus coli]|uniref:CtsR family transcriptional regulator n=1 Tax=Aedoeadaptatus coli TaxID=2058292 RepID=UPI000D562F1E|nr:CtsR family transcriptional regulator [Peptoniphilus coli]